MKQPIGDCVGRTRVRDKMDVLYDCTAVMQSPMFVRVAPFSKYYRYLTCGRSSRVVREPMVSSMYCSLFQQNQWCIKQSRVGGG
ncbi:unnamed protein product [Ectocarpus sp. 4 AP-2014]